MLRSIAQSASLATLLTLGLMASGATAQERLTWSGTGATSANQVWGIQSSNVMSKYSGVRVNITESPGSAANIDRISNKRAQLGHITTDIAHQAYHGTDDFQGKPYTGLRTLFMVHLLPLFMAVSESSGITSMSGLDGKPFSPGPPGFATSTLAIKAFEVLGIKPQFFRGSVADATNAMLDNRIVGITRAGGVPDSNLVEISVRMPLRLLSPSNEEIEKLKKAIPTTSVLTVRVPAGTYKGMPEVPAYKQIGFGLFVGTSNDISQAVGYNLVKAVFEHWQEGIGSLESFRALSPEALFRITLEYATVPLHAGTVQYFKEKGFAVPANLVPPEYK